MTFAAATRSQVPSPAPEPHRPRGERVKIDRQIRTRSKGVTRPSGMVATLRHDDDWAQSLVHRPPPLGRGGLGPDRDPDDRDRHGASDATTRPTSACPAPSPSTSSTCSRASSPPRAATSTRSSSTTRTGTVDAPTSAARSSRCWRRWQRMPHVVSVISPYAPGGRGPGLQGRAHRVRDGQLRQAREPAARQHRQAGARRGQSRSTSRACKLAAGGQVIEQAEGFSIGPATAVGVIAALVILLITFGSLMRGRDAADHRRARPDHRHRAGRARHARHQHVQHRARAGADDRARRRHRLRAVHRHALPRELRRASATSTASVIEAMDTSGRAILLAGATVVIALLGHVRDRRDASCTACRSRRCWRCCWCSPRR